MLYLEKRIFWQGQYIIKDENMCKHMGCNLTFLECGDPERKLEIYQHLVGAIRGTLLTNVRRETIPTFYKMTALSTHLHGVET